jgi:ABC-type bacteriocin/lantibiotic exporter with double-glycine peptidase domain
MNITKGERIFLCGQSGSGKSTLVKMLIKYYEIENDIIKIDNKDINDYNLLELRRDICYVSQKEKILTDSIYNNVVLDRDISYDEFLKLCKIFQIDNIVKNNICKYDMFLEEDGFNISGGERQKIIMARALIRNCSIYIFDESLSQVDVYNERIILTKIFEYLKDKTIIFISHRFDNKYLFDKVFNLGEGKIYA